MQPQFSRSTARILAASMVGTAVEFYDFYIYATAAALVLGPLFFPLDSPSAQLMAAYASIGVAFIARPLGAAAFGHFGDRIGRKSTLVASLLIMGVCTLLVAFLPGYAVLGWVAPFLLCVLRFGQGFGLGGEWGGAALLAVENAPPGWRGRFGMFPQMGAPIGFLASNGLFLILGHWLSDAGFRDWGWRMPFLGSTILVGLGLWVRLKISETPSFKRALEAGPPARVPFGEVVTQHLRALVGGIFAVVACFALFYLLTSFALGYGTTMQGIARQTYLKLQLFAILFMALGIIVAGWWSDKSSPSRVLTIGCLAVIPTGLLMEPLMGAAVPFDIGLFLVIGLFVMGLVYGPLGAYLPSLFPARVRYTGVSVAFNFGGIIGGALTPVFAQALVDKYHSLWPVGIYLGVAGVISFIGLKSAPVYRTDIVADAPQPVADAAGAGTAVEFVAQK